jgi:hypothetical protein
MSHSNVLNVMNVSLMLTPLFRRPPERI